MQHYKALVYYAQYLREIIRHLFIDHQLIIPDWDFYIGEGSDIVNAMHYYVIGDPIALLSALVPIKYMHYFYSFACILRLYLAGGSFSLLCFGTGNKNRYGIMAGSIAYVFCTWALLNAARHPYFLNPMIYFPFMILGIEKIIRKENPFIFIIATAISAASNFYFFYMIVILAVLYTIIRLGFLYRKEIKQALLTLCRIAVMAIIGVCIAGIILLPVFMVFLHDSRLSVSQPFHWLYPMSYYSGLPGIAISDKNDYWLCMGYTAPVILAVILLFLKRKKDTFLKILCVIAALIILFPIGGRILNGMSYMTNRWSWALAILCMYILVKKWNEMLSLTKKEWISLLIFSVAFYAICLLFEKSRTITVFSVLPLLFITLAIIRNEVYTNKRLLLKQAILIGLVALGTIGVAANKFSPAAGNYVSEAKKNSVIRDELANNETSIIKKISDFQYTRFSGRKLTKNANILNKISSTQYYWTISNPYMNNFRSALYLRESTFFNFEGYDDRATPLALSAVQYYSIKEDDDKNIIPYGYTSIEDIENDTYSIFRNKYALPIAYCYDAYFSKEIWDSYSPVQKQEAQLDAAYVDDFLEEIPEVQLDMPDYLVDYDIECQGIEISEQGNDIITTANDAKVILTLHQNVSHAEVYVGFTGLEFVPTPEYDLYFGDETIDPDDLYNRTNWDTLSQGTRKSIRKNKFFWKSVQNVDIEIKSSAGTNSEISYMQPDSSFSSGRHDFIANLGYSENETSTITITFPKRGVYSFESLDIYAIPMDEFGEKIAKLKEYGLQDIEFGNDTLTGYTNLDNTKLLCLAIAFSTGWEATIDDKNTEVYCINERYLGIVVPDGSHKIQFHYHMPYKKTGFGISIAGLIGFALVIVLNQRKKRKGMKA